MTEKVLNKHKAERMTLNMTITNTIIRQEHEYHSTLYYVPCFLSPLCVMSHFVFCFN